MVVVYALVVFAGAPICQIYYELPEGRQVEYAGSYQGQRGPQPSRLWRSVRKMLAGRRQAEAV